VVGGIENWRHAIEYMMWGATLVTACTSIVRRSGIEPLSIGPMPLAVRGLVQAVKAYEELTVEAALRGDRGLALEALMANPLVGSYDKAKGYLERVLEADREYLPRFFSR